MLCFLRCSAYGSIFLVLLHLLAAATIPDGKMFQTHNASKVSTTVSPKISLLGRPSYTKGKDDFITYHIAGTPTTLSFHSFGENIPAIKFLSTFKMARDIVENVVQKFGNEPITSGYWEYTMRFMDGDTISCILGDYRELGHPLRYERLLDVVEGLPQYMIEQGSFKNVYFEIELDKEGSVGSGRVQFNKSPPIPMQAGGGTLNGIKLNNTAESSTW
ncbi:MAG: hypothetical protein Q9164_002860 [Protoblastenia rupestris]